MGVVTDYAAEVVNGLLFGSSPFTEMRSLHYHLMSEVMGQLKKAWPKKYVRGVVFVHGYDLILSLFFRCHKDIYQLLELCCSSSSADLMDRIMAKISEIEDNCDLLTENHIKKLTKFIALIPVALKVIFADKDARDSLVFILLLNQGVQFVTCFKITC